MFWNNFLVSVNLLILSFCTLEFEFELEFEYNNFDILKFVFEMIEKFVNGLVWKYDFLVNYV